MANTEQREHISLAPLCGENSLEAWVQSLTENQRCMDCKAEIEGFAGAIVFSGQLPQTKLVGHWCEACWKRREEVRRYHLSSTPSRAETLLSAAPLSYP
jgi:hypothetical protein